MGLKTSGSYIEVEIAVTSVNRVTGMVNGNGTLVCPRVKPDELFRQ
jgi:hypothetical protein